MHRLLNPDNRRDNRCFDPTRGSRVLIGVNSAVRRCLVFR